MYCIIPSVETLIVSFSVKVYFMEFPVVVSEKERVWVGEYSVSMSKSNSNYVTSLNIWKPPYWIFTVTLKPLHTECWFSKNMSPDICIISLSFRSVPVGMCPCSDISAYFCVHRLFVEPVFAENLLAASRGPEMTEQCQYGLCWKEGPQRDQSGSK